MPNDFTPLSHEELRELWEQMRPNPADRRAVEMWKAGCAKLILSAVWWETLWYFTGSSLHDDEQKRAWFLAKLAEIGIELEGVKDA